MTASLGAPQFPSDDVLARTLFEEGIRHLEDARVLHEAGRHAAAITSSMKAAELCIKTVIVLDGAMGWWEKTFTTHSPLSDIKGLSIFQHHIVTLRGYRLTLIQDVVEMETLAPERPGKKGFDVRLEKNPEYPFLSFDTSAGVFLLDKPSSYFGETESNKFYNTAQDLMVALTTAYARVAQWGFALSPPL